MAVGDSTHTARRSRGWLCGRIWSSKGEYRCRYQPRKIIGCTSCFIRAGTWAAADPSNPGRGSPASGAEIKHANIFSVHGDVPKAVQRELAEAEAGYGLWKALWKDDKRDPYL